MTEKNFPDIVKDIHADDSKFGKGAYFFVNKTILSNREIVQATQRTGMYLEKIAEGIRLYALDRFGPMTMTLMNHWNIKHGFWRDRF